MASPKLLSVRDMTLIGIFAALTGIMAQISIPLTPVPFSFGIMGVMLTAIILETKLAVGAQIVYLLLGAVGVPVFAQFRSGLQALIGPTGGYLIAYVLMAWVMGLLFTHIKNSRSFLPAVLIGAVGLVICYAGGTLWLSISTGMPFSKALSVAVLPFVLFDSIKLVGATAVGLRVRETLRRASLLAS